MISDQFIQASGNLNQRNWGSRRITADDASYSQTACSGAYGLYTPLHTARYQAEDVFKRLSDWTAAHGVLEQSSRLAASFDHQFRRMLLAMYTADHAALDRALAALQSVYGQQLVYHFYAGYCDKHGIPNRAVVSG